MKVRRRLLSAVAAPNNSELLTFECGHTKLVPGKPSHKERLRCRRCERMLGARKGIFGGKTYIRRG